MSVDVYAVLLSAAFWDATRAFMLLAVLSCFAGVVLGLSAFTNGTKNRRVRTGGVALVLSGNTHTRTISSFVPLKTHCTSSKQRDFSEISSQQKVAI